MHIQRNSALQIPHINIFVSAIMSKSKPFQLFAAEVEGVGVCVCVYALDCVCVLCVYKRLCFLFVYIKVCVCASVGYQENTQCAAILKINSSTQTLTTLQMVIKILGMQK